MSSSGCKLIVFDLDGTLLDTGRGISKCIASTLGKMGFEVPDEETCKTFVGPPLKKRFLELFDADEKTADAVMKTFRDEYGNGDVFLADHYAGMDECLAALRKYYALAVATYKREDHAKQLLEKFGMDQYFDVICGSDAAAAMTKNQIVATAAERLDVPLADCVMVGDSDNDAIAAEQLGMQFIGVTYGYGFKSEADVAKYPHVACANSPMQLQTALDPSAQPLIVIARSVATKQSIKEL